MNATSIEWCDLSVNPIRATVGGSIGHYCEKISSGCAACYASRLQSRFKMPQFPGANGKSAAKPYLDENVLRSVLRRRKPAKVFWADMSDLFGHWVPDEWIDKCFAVMGFKGGLIHQVLTKRPQRMAEYLASRSKSIKHWESAARSLGITIQFEYEEATIGLVPFPLKNVWLGTSVENQTTADERIPHLLRCPAAVRFLSVEPMLGAVDLKIRGVLTGNRGGRVNIDGKIGDLPGIDWVIVGGESGPGARPMHPSWARSIRDQCAAAGVPFFFKQWGGVNKKRTGRLLDGRTWDEFPEAKIGATK